MEKPDSVFEFIHQTMNHPDNAFTVSELCAIGGVSRSGYYQWLKTAPARAAKEAEDQADFALILEEFLRHGRKKGARGIQMALLHREDGPVVMNLKKVRRLMAKYNLFCPIRKPNPQRRMAKALKTSNVAKNIVARKFEDYGPRRILLTDITYIPIRKAGQFAYLSTILDAYTKQILAYQISDSLEVDFVLATVEQLMDLHGNSLKEDSVLHSDQGCHYTSHRFIELVRNRKLRQSMSRKGNCWDNAPQESFFGHMKDEIKERLNSCRNYQEVKELLDEQIKYYNTSRYQWRLAKLSPDQFYEYVMTGEYPIKGIQVPRTLVGPKGQDRG